MKQNNKKIKIFCAGLSLVMIVALAATAALAETKAKEKIITAIEVKNNKTVNTQTVLSKVRSQVGKEFLPNVLGEDIKKLYATGYFADVSVDIEDFKDGVKITFMVQEKPVIDKIIIRGNKKIRQRRLQEKIQSKPNEVVNQQQLKTDAKAIADFYQERGYTNSQVDYKVEIDEQTNRGSVVFTIEEGSQVKVRKIEIKGNQAFKAGRLLKLLKTKRAWMFGKGFFKKDTFEEDLERIKSFYQDNGYLDVVLDYKIGYAHKNRFMIITINITEGKKYLTGTITFSGHKIATEELLREQIAMKPGSTYSETQLRRDISGVQSYYFNKGYINARIKVDTQFNAASGEVDLNYNIEENEVAYVDKIKISGNVRTRDMVIRRELKLAPGDKFDGEKLQRSKERLYNLDYFEEVTFDTEHTAEKNRENLLVNVKETKTGEFSFGAGYSSVDKMVGFVDVVQKNFDIANFPNFTGGGQRLRARAEFGTRKKDYELSFTEPWLYDRPISLGVDAYQRTREWEQYSQQRQGFDLRLGKEFREYLRGDITYRHENVKIFDLDSGVSNEISAEEGTNLISSITTGVTNDTRDNVFNPTKGYERSASVEVAGGMFGGDKDFVKYNLYHSWYWQQFKDIVLEFKLRGGYVDVYDDSPTVPIYERFYAGGANTLRGFKDRRVGPLDAAGDPIGGKAMFIANVEYLFPVIKNIKWALFYDTGNVWSRFSDLDLGDLRSSIGTGVRLKTPIGPIRLDYGYVLDRKADEAKDRIHFSMGYAF